MVAPGSLESVEMPSLNTSNLSTVPVGVQLPNYDREAISPGIVHLGIGAFHRAHMAVYVDDLLKQNPAWGIIGGSLRRPVPKAGEHTREILVEIGMDDAQIAEVLKSGAVRAG